MKVDAPEKIYLQEPTKVRTAKKYDNDVEYARTDAFIKKALKWYCLDCECNDNCKDIKCFFYREYERHLKDEANVTPPKFSDRIINEDGSVSENYLYRHFIAKMQDAFIEKACEYWYQYNQDVVSGFTVDVKDFRKYMEGK